MQPVIALHKSTVHGLPSSHEVTAPARQTLSLHVSPLVHASLSSQVTLLGRNTQPPASVHVASVQGLSSLQPIVVPMQLPWVHTSLVLQAWPSLHVLPSRFRTKQPVVGSQP